MSVMCEQPWLVSGRPLLLVSWVKNLGTWNVLWILICV